MGGKADAPCSNWGGRGGDWHQSSADRNQECFRRWLCYWHWPHYGFGGRDGNRICPRDLVADPNTRWRSGRIFLVLDIGKRSVLCRSDRLQFGFKRNLVWDAQLFGTDV